MGRERPRRGATVQRLEYRSLDLDEPLAVEESPDRGDHPRPQGKKLPCVLAGHKVELAMAKASLDVLQAVMLLRRGPQRFGQQREIRDPQGQLAPAGAEGHPLDPD